MQGFMQVIGGGGTLRGLQRARGFAHHRFKRLRAACDDPPINQLPADAFLNKEIIHFFREFGSVMCESRGGFPGDSVLFRHCRIQRLNNVVYLEPLALRNQPVVDSK